MTENMVRTQVYLPQATYRALVERAEKQGLTMAVQIRDALDAYLQRAQEEEEGVILQPDDPIFKMIGIYDSGVDDLAVNHDYYLYGMPKREPVDKLRVHESKVPQRKSRNRRSPRANKLSR
jgi:hypothetical protein